MSEHYSVRLCSEKSAYEIRAKKRVSLDLPALANKIAAQLGMRVRLSLPALLILMADDGRVFNIFPDGRMLLRGLNSSDDAERFAHELAEIIYGATNEVE